MSAAALTIILAVVAAVPASLAAILGVMTLIRSNQIHSLIIANQVVNESFAKLQQALTEATTEIVVLEAIIKDRGVRPFVVAAVPVNEASSTGEKNGNS